MRKAQVLVSVLLLVLLLAACAPAAAPAPALPAPALAPAAPLSAPAKLAWQTEWERVVSAAKQEGRVSLFSGGLTGATRTVVAQAFKTAYGIPLEAVVQAGSPGANRVLSERRAGIYSYDILLMGGPSNTMFKPAGALDPVDLALILPEVTDPELIKKTWARGKLWWLDSDHMALSSAIRVNNPIAINTNLVKEGELNSYRDLLSPKWRGKIILTDPTISGSGGNFLAFIDAVLGWDYLVELVQKAEPSVQRDQRLVLDWLAQGKVALAVFPDQTMLVEFMRIGAPVKGLFLAEGTWVSTGGVMTISVFKKGPHPNAAKVFTNWYLSKEGQKIWVVPMEALSLRLDVPADHLSAEMRWQEGMKYFTIDEEAILAGPALQKRAGELLGPLTRK